MADIYKFPLTKVDRVPKLATALLRVVELSDAEEPEDQIAALLLVQAAIQQIVFKEKGYAELRRVVVAAAERRRRYEVSTPPKGPEIDG